MVGHPPHFSNGDGLGPRRMNLDIEIDSHTDIYGTISAWWNKMMDGNKDWQKGATYSYTIKSTRFWVDYTKGLPFDEFCREWICVYCLEQMLVDWLAVSTFFPRPLQARCLPTDYIRPTYYIVNGAVYLVEIMLWICLGLSKSTVALQAARVVLSVVSLIVALGFSIYGVRLFFILRSFPMESKGRQKKLHEAAISAFLDDDLSLEVDAMTQPLGDLLYYMTVEIVPSALVLFILRKLPPKRVSDEYDPVQ
ncbi:hypothetical protein Cgig2_001857 [Carnegiea gigantea]|uniref:THH1/TOM1/TOM3 domain-containing protein n=1 Tax=Carnegiea gigantea TaxID=171969 RepID=A0A9Q1JZE8_9CARY|nr:hypothetical protein Cgig2_001857 [Carnegiea gigantea]